MKQFILLLPALICCTANISAQDSDFETWAKQKREQYDKWQKMRAEIVSHLPDNPDAGKISSFIDTGFNQPQAATPVHQSSAPAQQPATITAPQQLAPAPTLQLPAFKVWVVVVGVATYSNPGINLNYTDDDAYKMYAFYKSLEGGSVPDRQISVLIDEEATRPNILRAINATYANAGKDDAIIFYFSGHGAESAFITHDFDNTDLAHNKGLLLHSELRAIFDKSQARYKYIIADACHSGGAVRRNIRENTGTKATFYQAFDNNKKGFVMLLSSMGNEYSLESQGIRQGVFSHYLLRGLKGESDTNNDHIVSVTELYDYVRKNVSGYTEGKQNPVFDGDKDTGLPIAVIRD